MKNLDALIPKSHSISNILSLFGSIKKNCIWINIPVGYL